VFGLILWLIMLPSYNYVLCNSSAFPESIYLTRGIYSCLWKYGQSQSQNIKSVFSSYSVKFAKLIATFYTRFKQFIMSEACKFGFLDSAVLFSLKNKILLHYWTHNLQISKFLSLKWKLMKGENMTIPKSLRFNWL